ncbi:hypothetical protein [Acidovorax sp. SUPP2825]|uniref:hypothetical protein n=1 Tax=Acidovorax sp. SUPP2825 TaxID=2920879 RepID=UPI0023DE5080|nr:hypothetical protein [Acidovorax sp. SUPP2825]GKS97000.1 hypothetical protein AVAK2825_20715 [Acidovorax sp. SUPP2825]
MTASSWVLIAKLLGTAALLSLAVTGVRSCQEHYRDQGRQQVQAAWDTDRQEQRRVAESARAARERDERTKEQNMALGAEENVRVQVQREESTVRRDAGLQRSADGMHSTIARADTDSHARRAASSCPAADAEAHEAATARGLLGACTGRYRQLAKSAADLADQVTGLQDHVLLLQPEAAALVGGETP